MAVPRIVQTVLDTDDPRSLAEFYRELFGLSYRDGDEPPPTGESDERGLDWLVLRAPDGGRALAFQYVEDYRPPVWGDPAAPQQLHLDTIVDTVEELHATAARVEQLGGRIGFDRTADPDEPLYVFVDPAGHPFCVFV